MRTISNEQWLALEDLSAQGLLEGLPPQTAEKDIHVTDLLNRLSTLEVRHDHFQGRRRGEPAIVDDGIKLIFAGGTCLSKAYGLINRMSEDIDIKVVLGAPTRKLKKDAGNRSRLKAMCSAIDLALTELEFELPSKMDERVNPRIRDKYRHYVIGARYAGRGARLPSLRPDHSYMKARRFHIGRPMRNLSWQQLNSWPNSPLPPHDLSHRHRYNPKYFLPRI